MRRPTKLKFRPSGIHRNLSCPGSAWVQTAVRTRSGPEAEEGTQAHAELAAELTGKPVADFLEKPEKLKKGEKPKEPIVIPDEDKALLKEMADMIRTLADLDSCEMFIEQPLESVYNGVKITGTADVLLVASDRLILLDYKHGAGRRVKVEANPQLSMYADMAAELYPDLEIEFGVIQPRGVGLGLTTWLPPAGYFETFRRNVEAAIRKAFDNPPQYNEGPWCWGCAGEKLGVCPAKLAKALEYAVAVENGAGDGALALGKMGAKESRTVTLPWWLLDLVKVAEKISKNLRTEADIRLRAGREVPGWTLKNTTGRSAWAVPEEVPDVLAQLSGLSRDMFVNQPPPKPIGITDAKAMLKGIDLTPHIHRPPGKTMAPAPNDTGSLFGEVE